jgi:hypothetical protein
MAALLTVIDLSVGKQGCHPDYMDRTRQQHHMNTVFIGLECHGLSFLIMDILITGRLCDQLVSSIWQSS